MRDVLKKRLKKLLEDLASQASPQGPLQLVRDAYKACMHVSKIEELSVQYLKGILNSLDLDGPLKS